MMAYDLGSAVIDFVQERHGFYKLSSYFADVRGGRSHDDAFRAAFGADEAQFERDFGAFLAGHSTGSWTGP
jgi:hypothetical protein